MLASQALLLPGIGNVGPCVDANSSSDCQGKTGTQDMTWYVCLLIISIIVSAVVTWDASPKLVSVCSV